MTWFGNLDSHIIKAQHNCVSDNRTYNGKFIPIVHEHLLVFKKNQIWTVPMQFTKRLLRDMRDSLVVTWRDLVQATMESLGGQASLQQIYEALKNSKKAEQNSNWQAKVRQVLQLHPQMVKNM